MVVLRKPPSTTGDFGGTRLSLLLEKQHNRGQDGAGVAILSADPAPGSPPYQVFKSASATPLADILGMIAKRECSQDRIFLGHLRYATFGKNEIAFCHPFIHQASELDLTLLLAGNFNLTNAPELFDDYRRHGSFPTSKADGYLVTELIAHELARRLPPVNENGTFECTHPPLAEALAAALKNADGAWTLIGATGDGWAFATRDPHGIRPGWFYIDDNVVVVASERPAIQAAFDVPPESVKEIPPGETLVVSPDGAISWKSLDFCGLTSDNANLPSDTQNSSQAKPPYRPCAFERIYFSRANDADIHRERKALGAALLPAILKASNAPLEDIFFSYIPNSARIAFHGLLERLFDEHGKIRFGEVAVKDAKFRTFIADAAARREFYKHVYDVTYGLVRTAKDTLVVLDDSIVRGNTMKNAILPMLDRLGPKRIVIASSAPPIRYPDCYGIDMSTLGELVAFRALVKLMGDNAEEELRTALKEEQTPSGNPLAALYARFPNEEHSAEIARLLTPPGMKAEVVVVYQTIDALRECLAPPSGHNSERNQLPIGDWYFTGDYPSPGGYKVLRKALMNYLERSSERSY